MHHKGPDPASPAATASSMTMVCADPASRALAKLLARIAPSDVPVLISGAPGTGKEVLARHIHRTSGRGGMFVGVNCNAVADQLAPGEADAPPAAPHGLGTAARGERWFESAREGTLFLDEIGTLPSGPQNQLLRLLQEQEMAQAATRDPVQSNVRLVASSTIDLEEAVAAGRFRLELFYRLNVGQVRLLPLRQRPGDVAALAAHFLLLHAVRLNLPPPRLSEQAMGMLEQYSWPGNVRELENAIRFALLVTTEQELRAEHLRLGGAPRLATSQTLQASAFRSGELADKGAPELSLSQLLPPLFHNPGNNLLGDLEQQIVAEAFRFTGRNQVRTAALLGISRNVLRTLLRKHGLLVVRRRNARSTT
jgi:DNA-binding NtrC family response regulator